jgi:hypothetical protein
MKYLVSLEGERIHIVNNEKELKFFLNNKKIELEKRGCENVNKWFEDMINNGFSHHFAYYPDYILPLDKTDEKNFLKSINK